MKLAGVGPNTPIITNGKGASQSDLPYRFDLIDTKALFELGRILKKGAEKYGVDNWRDIDQTDHLNHAIAHIFAHIAGDKQDEHLAHAFARMMFAVGVSENEKEDREEPAGESIEETIEKEKSKELTKENISEPTKNPESDKSKPKIDKFEIVKYLIENPTHSVETMALVRFGTTLQTLSTTMSLKGIKSKDIRRGILPEWYTGKYNNEVVNESAENLTCGQLTLSQVKKMYITENKTNAEVAKLAGMNIQDFREWRIKNGIRKGGVNN
jgi:hypothetical protein